MGKRRLAKPGWSSKQKMVDRLPSIPRRFDEDLQVVLDLGLPDVLVESPGSERLIQGLIFRACRCRDVPICLVLFRHRVSRCKPSNGQAPTTLAFVLASSPEPVFVDRPCATASNWAIGTEMPQELLWTTGDTPVELGRLLTNLGIGAVLALILRFHFRRFGSTLSNREEFAQVFPFILLTTILIITVVKSSLALSLGLVGALSIVRFRTPIKEPEELAYLFISIAMGLGLGADQAKETIIASLVILGIMAALGRFRKDEGGKNIYLSVDWRGNEEEAPESYLKRLTEIVGRHSVRSDLRRFDVRDGALEVTCFLDIESTKQLSALTDELRATFPGVGVTFLDQNQLPSV